MEDPVAADGGGQQNETGSEQVDNLTSSTETENEGFDADMFASMMQQELISYSLSWEPLLKILRALGASMAKQQKAQETTQQSNEAALKKMEDHVAQQEQQLADLRDRLARSEDEKCEAAAAMQAMQTQVGEMQNQLEGIQGPTPLVDDRQEQQEEAVIDQGNAPFDSEGGVDNSSSSTVKKSPRSSRLSNTDRPSFVTAKDLADAKQELRHELEKALARTFDRNTVDKTGEEKGEEGTTIGMDVGSDTESSVKTPRSARASEVQPGASLTPMLHQDVEKLQGLQDTLAARVSEHDRILDILNSRMGKLDELSSQMYDLAANPQSTDESNGKDGSDGNSPSRDIENVKNDEFVLITNDIMNELKALKAVQDDHDQKLREHDEAVDKHTADIKALTDSLDELSVQQQTMASLYPSNTSNGGSGGGNTGVSTDDTGKSGKTDKQAGTASEATSQPQLDLSLIFTKLADLRRSTDASLQNLQQTIKGVSGTTQSQQEQLDALRNNAVFNEHLQAHLVEARLAMQKELLARNQAFQDHTKPQLVEWRKALELTEDKLLQGNSDDEMLHALQQMQRGYHRTLLSITPLVNSPLSISETLQTLSDEVKQLQNAVRLGVVPLRIADNNAGDGDQHKGDREEEYTRKLRYLDEEIDATLQVNITTEKKNDPLIKGLDAMREKLELLWSMWHRNYNVNSMQPSEPVISHGSKNSSTAGDGVHAGQEERRPSIQQRNPDGLREMELRLSGAVRRLAMVEEDIERLNSITAELSAADKRKAPETVTGTRRGSSNNNLRTELVMDEMEKLRKEMYVELSKISEQQAENTGNNCNSNTSLVSVDRRSMVEAAARQGDVLTDLFSQMTGRELDTRLYNTPDGQKQFYDNFIKEVTKKVSSAINLEKGAPRGPGVGGAASANVNYRLLLDNFAQKVDDRLEDAREFTTEELARLRRELMEQLKVRFEVALRDIRGELMLLQPTDGDSTAMGTKPVMCVACSRPVPVSSVIREAGSIPTEMGNHEPLNSSLAAEFDYDRPDDDFVFRAGFKMPANDRKILTLPFLTTAMRNRMVLNNSEGKRKRPPRQSHLSRVDNVVREAMELDRASRSRTFDAE
ncbi:hypothetical protein GN244_ATG06681 [Phytophthora infestans]|uniref:Uncharacterized protein n=1 Tax=Phytophthora infestans TaxID=4787 RepID=A0A833WGH0_PHYIN|nr:hypothetical protein GN244_ATG06681 [Phytophthora infestans]KAF4142241.1 hypothetical protein GN958_ATG08417 [Phytophthora infestans]